MVTIDRNDPCPCGSTKKFKHCCQRKEKAQKSRPHPDAALLPMWLKLATQHLQAGRLTQAKSGYEQVLRVNPLQPEALQWMGVVCHQFGDNEKAIELVRQAIDLAPAIAFFRSALGNVLQAVGRSTEAIESYRQALLIKPDFAEAHNNLGIAFHAQGEPGKAIESYRKAIALIPNYADAYNNLGTALYASGLEDEAVRAYQKALAINPNHAKALFNLGSAVHRQTPDLAVSLINRSLQLQPDFYEAWLNLGKLLISQCRMDEASRSLQRAIALKPGNGLRVLDALKISPIMGTREALLEERASFESNLDRLLQEGLTLDDPVTEHCKTNFHLAYHGVNDRAIQTKIFQFFSRACPDLLYVAPHCGRRRSEGQKIRIGFLSAFIANHSVSLCFSAIVQALATQEAFEVCLLSSHDPEEKNAKRTYSNFSGNVVHLNGDMVLARQQVSALELDILVYLDVGMDAASYFLAFSRLARVQCVLGGHPVTTGIDAMDYFLSSDLAEPTDADSHYSEKLVRLPLGAFYFERPAMPAAFKTRKELGLPEHGGIYLCPLVLHKIHPDFDEAIGRILQLDTSGHVVMFADKKYSTWQGLLEKRFDQTIAQEMRSRIIFLPWVTGSVEFMQINEAADVVIDPFHFGIGSTAIATCSVGTPFVTKPGEFMRGRVGLFYCRIMDLMECVALGTEDYAQKAVAIATDHSLRDSLKAKILKNNRALFENRQAITDLTDFFLDVGNRL